MTNTALTRIATTVAGAALVFGLGAAIIGTEAQAGSTVVVAEESNPWNSAQADSNPWNGTQDEDSNPWNGAPASNPWN